MAPLDQVDHFINTVYTDPRFRPPRPESTPVAPGGPSTPQGAIAPQRPHQHSRRPSCRRYPRSAISPEEPCSELRAVHGARVCTEAYRSDHTKITIVLKGTKLPGYRPRRDAVQDTSLWNKASRLSDSTQQGHLSKYRRGVFTLPTRPRPKRRDNTFCVFSLLLRQALRPSRLAPAASRCVTTRRSVCGRAGHPRWRRSCARPRRRSEGSGPPGSSRASTLLSSSSWRHLEAAPRAEGFFSRRSARFFSRRSAPEWERWCDCSCGPEFEKGDGRLRPSLQQRLPGAEGPPEVCVCVS